MSIFVCWFFAEFDRGEYFGRKKKLPVGPKNPLSITAL
jgi:hypothetical protein